MGALRLLILALVLAVTASIAASAIPGSRLSTSIGPAVAEAAVKPKRPKNVPVPCPNIATRTITNIPRMAGGTAAQQYVFQRQVECVVKAMPAGQTIWIAIYGSDIPWVTTALINAHRRGVNVRITMWGERVRPNNKEAVRLMNVLGRNPSARSYLIPCVGSCLMNGVVGIHHAKGIAVSMAYGKSGKRTIPVRNIVFVGSANFTNGNSAGSWNTTQEVVGDARLYSGLASYVSATRLDRYHAPFAAVKSANGRYEIHFSPGKKSDDPIYKLLKSVKCTYKEGGKKKRTSIRISVYKWTQGQMRLLKQVQKLKKRGCSIGVVTSTVKREADAGKRVRPLRSIVSARLAYSRIPVYDSTRDMNRDGKNDLSTHDKSIAVIGALKGRKGTQYVSIVGGRNWTSDGLTENTEIAMKVLDKAAAQALFASWTRQARLAYRIQPCKLTKAVKKRGYCPRQLSPHYQ